MKAFDASQLREWITFERPVEAPIDGGAGETALTWIAARKVRAAVYTVQMSEQMTADQPKTVGTHDVKVRYASDIDSTWRICWKGKAFDIIGIVNTGERNVELVIRCGSVNA